MGGISALISPDITVRLRQENNEVIISVADQGPGNLIVKKIVEAHEGKIWFISEPGKGGEFFSPCRVVSQRDDG